MPPSVPARRILFVDHSSALGDDQLSLLDIAVAHRDRGAVALFQDGPFAAALVSRNVALLPVATSRACVRAMSRPRASIALVPAAYALSGVARSFGVLYANSPTSFLICAAAGLLAGRPVVWHLRHALDHPPSGRLHLRILVAVANARAAGVVANSRATADAFVAAGGRRQHVRMIHDGIDTAPFDRIEPQVRGDVRRALGIDEHTYVIGSLRDHTAPRERVLLDALEMLPDSLALVVGRAVGAGGEDARLIAACDVLVDTSNASELSVRRLVKALLGRRPLIANDVSGVREIIEDGVTGILVPPGDSAALAAAIRGLRDEPVRGDEMGFAGATDARRRFSRVSMNASITQVVDDVLRGVNEPRAPGGMREPVARRNLPRSPTSHRPASAMMATSDSSRVSRANYGIDAPGVVRAMALLAMALIGAGLVLTAASRAGSASARFGITLLWPGASFAVTALLMLASSRFGKQRARDRLLDYLALRGDETVLDIGCGHGLLLLGAAQRLPRGHAIGIDLWSQADQYANTAAATLANADAEGVSDRVTVRDGDMRELPLEDESVDVVVSSLAIHNVPTAVDRARAMREIARVVRPGGRVAILDIAHVGDYARALRDAGWTVERNGVTPWIFPPTRELVARKPS